MNCQYWGKNGRQQINTQ